MFYLTTDKDRLRKIMEELVELNNKRLEDIDDERKLLITTTNKYEELIELLK